jgi:hypothetical protein
MNARPSLQMLLNTKVPEPTGKCIRMALQKASFINPAKYLISLDKARDSHIMDKERSVTMVGDLKQCRKWELAKSPTKDLSLKWCISAIRAAESSPSSGECGPMGWLGLISRPIAVWLPQ